MNAISGSGNIYASAPYVVGYMTKIAAIKGTDHTPNLFHALAALGTKRRIRKIIASAPIPKSKGVPILAYERTQIGSQIFGVQTQIPNLTELVRTYPVIAANKDIKKNQTVAFFGFFIS